MDDTTGDDGELTPQLVMEEIRVEGSREDYNKLVFQSRGLHSLIKKALKNKGVNKDWIKRARMIPIEDCTRGFHRATDVLIYNRDDFRELTFGLYEKADVTKYMNGVAGLIDPHQLEVRPVFLPPDSGKVKQPMDVLLRGFWGWYSERTIEEEHKLLMGEPYTKKEPIAEVWKYEPSISACDDKAYLAFYTKQGNWFKGARLAVDKVLGFGIMSGSAVRLSWVYFPVEQQYAPKLEKLVQDSIKSLH